MGVDLLLPSAAYQPSLISSGQSLKEALISMSSILNVKPTYRVSSCTSFLKSCGLGR